MERAEPVLRLRRKSVYQSLEAVPPILGRWGQYPLWGECPLDVVV
jgi:hypothetical protein